MSFTKQFDQLKNLVEKNLVKVLDEKKNSIPPTLFSSMNYSLFSGGKRIRPVLFLAAIQMYNKEFDDEIIKFACAIEILHTYTLIHDDLPCMDNDDYRRGKLTNHKVYGEGLAVLTGDALLNFAFELILQSCNGGNLFIKAGQYFSHLVGPSGLIAGQVVDIKKIDDITEKSNLINYIYQHKTSDLIKGSILAGAIIGGANQDEIKILEKFADYFGYSFQLKDDLLDAGKEKDTDSNSIINIYNEKYANNMLKEVTTSAVNEINKLDKDVTFFIKLSCKLSGRKE